MKHFLPIKNLFDLGVWMFWVGTILTFLFALDSDGDALSFWFVGSQIGFMMIGASLIEEKVERHDQIGGWFMIFGFLLLVVSAIQIGRLLI